MTEISGDNNNTTTTHKVVIPFYIYAAISFLAATVLLFLSAKDFTGHYFQPQILSITHILALGCGTMIIMGASHQLVPVFTESRLYSNTLAWLSFILVAVGTPLLIYAFSAFSFNWMAKTGGTLINVSVIFYIINLMMSAGINRSGNIHLLFIVTATLWLLATTVIGLLLVYNFTIPLLDKDSLHYLSMHAHMGIAGWFLLLIIGVASRLIPMFLISKYDNTKKLWLIYGFINGGLIAFLFAFVFFSATSFYLLPAGCIFAGIILFGNYCYCAYKQRLRRTLDPQMKTSVMAVIMMLIPLIFLFCIIFLMFSRSPEPRIVLAYGFTIFFGWLTAIILGMTFKTLPFIVWNKIYHAAGGQTTDPKDMFNNKIFVGMAVLYIAGFILFATGIISAYVMALQAGAIFLILTAILYNSLVLQILMHKPARV